ncbi:MAG: response regulator [Candidatus Wallbacteria bacterium]|nr:response regulator [Candidatus Wallbacteria bacterium]
MTFDTLANSLQNCLLLLDEAGGIVRLNPVAEELLGLQLKGAKGRSYRDLGLPEPLVAAVCRCLIGGEPEAVLAEFPGPGGQGVWLDVRLTAWAEPAGAARHGVLFNGIDVTAAHALQTAWVRSSKLASLGTMAAALAHEINNPLTVVLGTLDVLLAEVEASQPELAATLRRIERGSWQCVEIVRTFLKVSRTQPVGARPVLLGEIVNDLLTLLGKQLATASIDVALELHTDLPAVSADPTHVQQVLLNLILNARDAMPTGGRLVVRSRPEPSSVVLEVQDSGSGIPEDVMKRIFDPFFTTKPSGRGTGLGLSICKSLIEEHRGQIWVSSKLGAGSTFSIRLMRSDAAADDPAASSGRRQRPDRVDLRILAIDDEPDILHVLKTYLTRAGCSVSGFTSGAEALERLVPGQYDLALLDLQMPKMNGREVRRRLRGIDPALPVVFVTGTLLQDLDFIDDGDPLILGCVQKPFSDRDLRTWLDRVSRSRPAGGLGAPDAVSAPAAAERACRVLVIDDDQALLFLMKQLLEAAGQFHVEVAETAMDGIRMAKEQQPDLILLDVMMPVVDGLEACRLLRAEPATARIPICMISAKSDLADVVKALSAGAVHYLMKPIDPLGLPKKIREIVAESRGLRANRHRASLAEQRAPSD